MLLRRALAIATGKSRGHGRIARFKFIDVRADGPTMVARFPQQVLLLLVLVTGASTGEAEDPRWSTYSARKTSRSSTPRSWPSSSLEHAARESRPSNGKLPETTPWSVDRSNPGTRSDPSFLGTVVERSEEDEDGKRIRQSPGSNGIEDARNARYNPSISSMSDKISQTDPSNRISIESSSPQSSTVGYYLAKISSVPGNSHDIVATSETRLLSETLSRENFKNTTPMTTDIMMPRRQMRHILEKHPCEKFQIGDMTKREFYSPNYPASYPNQADCIRVLEADKGMLLKLDFRDEFNLEDSPDCHFDFLEVRDGQYGYSNLLGKFCGTNFPPEITSKTRYLWLRFQSDDNIEGKGFKAVWNMIPRPTHPGVPPEPEPCIVNVTDESQKIIGSNDVKERKILAEKEGLALDCMWIIKVKEGWKIQLTFPDTFKLERPNECDANFVDIFKEYTDMSSRVKNFCGSIADTANIAGHIAHLRFYAEPKAINSTFEAVMTAVRDKDGDKPCDADEYDCEDNTCIAANLECNGFVNCRFRWDEDETKCNKKKSRLIDSQHIVIILVVFSLIMFGMSFAFVFNCVRKLIRDHRIIQEHIRQSRENRLDELGRKSTPCPISSSRTDLREHDSESPSLEVLPSKELMPPTTMISQEYTKDLVLELAYNAGDITDIHQSNNVSNATQERLQESSEEPEMRDNSCQTRESLFEPRVLDAMGFTTFGVRAPSSQNGTNLHHHYRHHHQQQLQQSPQSHLESIQSSQPGSQTSQHSSQQQSVSQCSGCSPASRGRDGSMGVCPKHHPIPAPPGWSMHESYSLSQTAQYPEQLDYPTYQRYQSPKPGRDVYRQSPKFARQPTAGSGERYGSSVYGSGHGSSNTTSSTSQHSSGNTPTKRQPQPVDPRYRAEAVIEVDQRRPFSIESTKSAPDVIATH